MAIKLLQDVACEGKIVVIRQDLNVPMKEGVITNDKRIRAALPGVRMALEKGAAERAAEPATSYKRSPKEPQTPSSALTDEPRRPKRCARISTPPTSHAARSDAHASAPHRRATPPEAIKAPAWLGPGVRQHAAACPACASVGTGAPMRPCVAWLRQRAPVWAWLRQHAPVWAWLHVCAPVWAW